jgi:hypothetical protein
MANNNKKLCLPLKDPPPIPIPSGTIVTASSHTADGKSWIHRDIDAGRYGAIEDYKYKISRINPLLVEKVEIEVIEYQDKLDQLYDKKLI